MGYHAKSLHNSKACRQPWHSWRAAIPPSTASWVGECFLCLHAQVGSTLIAGLGFAGYTHPKPEWAFNNGQFTEMSDGHAPAFLPSLGNTVPISGSEGQYTSSVIGCT